MPSKKRAPKLRAETSARVQVNLPQPAKASGFPDLGKLYAWMQASIMEGEEAQSQDDAVLAEIRPNSRQSARRRLQIYTNDFYGRFRDVMAVDYSALEYVMGHEAWGELVDAFVFAHPSRSPIINRYGYDLPEFLKGYEVAEHAFVADVARLQMEVARRQGKPIETSLDPSELAAIAPDAWEAVSLRPRASVDSYAFSYDVNRFLNEYFADEEPAAPTKIAPTWVQVYCGEDEVWRQPISQARHEALQALKRGETIAAALNHASEFLDADKENEGDNFAAAIQEWFADWMRDGIFAQIVHVD